MAFFKSKKQNIKTPIPVPAVLSDSKDSLSIIDIIAPPSIEVRPDNIKIGERLSKTYYVYSYPRYLYSGWLSPIINLNHMMDISFFVHPIETEKILKTLRRKVTEVQAELAEREEKGLVRDPQLEVSFQDLEQLRNDLQTAQERMFYFGLYLTIYGDTEEELRETEIDLRSILESRLIYIKPASFKQKEGFISSCPYDLDLLMEFSQLNTGPISSAFPFASFDLSSNDGILYGINQHNSSLILFDRFTLPNANEVIFGESGSGKSYAVKLEILRSMMMGTDVIVIDPENEYKHLADTVGGSFYNISLSSKNHLNPFDLPVPMEDESPEDVIRTNIINLVSLFRIMLGGLAPEEDAIIDRALNETYSAKDITGKSDPKKWGKKNGLEFPLFSDFEEVLSSMEDAESLLKRIRKFSKGTFANFFNNPSNVEIKDRLVVFGIRDMEDELRPIAIFILLRYIWKAVASNIKKRILVIDEAWWLMQNEDGASFLFGTVKRARKYWLGVTTVTQDVEDFMKSSFGKPIITNSAITLLMKQSPATIKFVQESFNLTDQEKMILMESPTGVGIFFAGLKHVLMQIIASYAEDEFITSSPEEIKKIKEAKEELK